MDDPTILALSTGQDQLLQAFIDSVHTRLSNQVAGKHWLVTGPRGGGKSFFLRFVQARFNQIKNPKIKIVLLPEELVNIFSPHEWLNAVNHLLDPKQNNTDSVSAWNSQSSDEAWDKALKSLLKACKTELLIIAVENFDDLLKQAFGNDVDSSRLRSLLENEARVMLLATAVDSSFDENYNNRLFRQFEHHQIQPWESQAHRDYLIKRATLEKKKPDTTQLARIDAYSRYTGGNARVASVLASLILEKQDPLLASADLAATLDKMTDYYRAQVERIPVRTRKLFDALLRGGEPCSQTELAERVQARQSDISRAFTWLMDFGYIIGLREKGQKATRYQVADRLFSQFYRMRYLQSGQNTQLTLLADLLADTIEFADKWRYADRYFNDGFEDEARIMAELGLNDRGINVEDISEHYQSTQSLVALGHDWESRDNLPNLLELVKNLDKHYATDEELTEAISKAKELASATNRFDLLGVQLVKLIDGSFSLNPLEKYRFYCEMVKESFSQREWVELINFFEHEIKKIAQLEKEYPTDIAILKARIKLGNQYPLAVSFDGISSQSQELMTFENLSRLETLTFQMHCATISVALWSSHQHWKNAAISLDRCLIITSVLRTQFYAIDMILENLLPIQIHSGSAIDKMALIDYWIGECLLELDQTKEAMEAFSKSRKKALKNEQPKPASIYLDKMAWCHSVLNNLTDSIELHKQSISEQETLNITTNIAWNIGQIARHKVALEGMTVAWGFLDKHEFSEEKDRTKSVQQLADTIFDCVQNKGETAAFSLGCQLFLELKRRPQYPVETILRALWIDMVDMRVPFVVLRDLSAETKNILGDDLAPLIEMLIAWLDDLEQSPQQRIEHRKTLNPDLATTLEALGENLSPKTKVALQLL